MYHPQPVTHLSVQARLDMTVIGVPALYAAAGICACAAFHHFLISWCKPLERTHLLFAFQCLTAMFFFVVAAGAYQAETAAALIAARRWQVTLGVIFLLAFVWFIHKHTYLRGRALPLAFCAYLALMLAANLLLPYGLAFREVPVLEYLTLPWGEQVVDPRPHQVHGWFYAWWTGLLAVFIYGGYAGTRHYRDRGRSRAAAWLVGLGTFFIFWCVTVAIQYRLIAFVNLTEFGFLAIVVVMSFAFTRELRERQRRLNLVIDNVPAAVYLKDLDGRYLLINREFEKRTRTSNRAVAGKTAYDLFPVAQAAALRAKDLQVLQTRKPAQFEEEVMAEDRKMHTYELLQFPLLDTDGVPYGLCGVSTDVTSLRRGELEMRSLRQQLWHSDRVARTGALAASLAHELRQPLAAVLHNAQAELRNLANAEPDSQQITAMLSDVVRDAKRAAAVINGLQAFVRREEPARERVDVASVVRELLDLLHSELVKQGVEVDTQIEDASCVFADRAQVQQVMLNLVMNAIDAMRERPDGQRRVGISIGRAGGEQIRVAVSDSGMGIARENLDKLFDAFWTTKASGMGLGLAICRSIVESHGGTIRVQANGERGVTVVFTLPTNQPGVAATAVAS
jgi:PAS domain S-box-containing protein